MPRILKNACKRNYCPNITQKSVITDNAPYRSIKLNKPPSKYATKKDDRLTGKQRNQLLGKCAKIRAFSKA